MRSDGDYPEAKCPVDHKTREAWLQAAKAKKQASPTHPPSTPSPTAILIPPGARYSLDSGSWTTSSPAPFNEPAARRPKIYSLSTDREISTIPRAIAQDISSLNAAERAALPAANSEADTGHDRDSGNWIYPSQEMFFNAMQRKGHNANPSDMSSIVPIHNAVNERAWKEIKKWEEGWGAERCGGPKLVSFAGDSKKLTPKAWIYGWLFGYARPFDRHDWIVDRCGRKIEYVIDFYKGKGGGLAFHLDARPKVNSWDGIKMRIVNVFT